MLDVVDAIPSGRVSTYGDVTELLGRGAARGVGMVLHRWGVEVPWHRVVRSDGSPPPALAEEALALLTAEGVPVRAGRVLLDRARWDGTSAAGQPV